MNKKQLKVCADVLTAFAVFVAAIMIVMIVLDFVHLGDLNNMFVVGVIDAQEYSIFSQHAIMSGVFAILSLIMCSVIIALSRVKVGDPAVAIAIFVLNLIIDSLFIGMIFLLPLIHLIMVFISPVFMLLLFSDALAYLIMSCQSGKEHEHAPKPAVVNTADCAQSLRDLKDLFENGLLTEEEYSMQRERILKRMLNE